MTLTQKGSRAATVAAMAEDILESDPETFASGKKEKDDDENSEIKKRDKAIAEWIGQPFKPPSRNKDKEDEDERKIFWCPSSFNRRTLPGETDDEGFADNREDDSIYDREDTVLYDDKDNKEEASLGHEGVSSS